MHRGDLVEQYMGNLLVAEQAPEAPRGTTIVRRSRAAEGLERCSRAQERCLDRRAAVAERKHRAVEARQAWAELRHLEVLLRFHRRPAPGGS
jgi:hypothetical protein